MLARRAGNRARSFALCVGADLSAFETAVHHMLMALRAWLLTSMFTIQSFLARMGSVLDPLDGAFIGQRLVERLTGITCRVAALATAGHQFCTPDLAAIVLRVLRARHLGPMFTVRKLFLHLFIATNTFEHVELEANRRTVSQVAQ